MKKTIITVIITLCFFLTACSKEKLFTSQNSGSIHTGLNIITVNSTTGSLLKSCTQEKLRDIKALKMDELVHNCSKKSSHERFMDGLGGVSPEYIIAEGTIMMPSYGEESENTFICTINDSTYINHKDSQRDTEIAGYNAILHVIGKGLLDEINPRMYPDSMYCENNNFECNDMIDFEGWSDGSGNYFVAGFRTQLENDKYHIYYVINDLLYDPGSTQHGDGILTKSKRNFVDIKDNKIIVQRFINGYLPDGIDLSDPNLDPATIESPVEIEICEIQIKK